MSACSHLSSQEVTKAERRRMFELLMSDDPNMQKEASDTVNEYTKVYMREEGFARKVLPPIMLTNDELDRVVWHDKPIKIVDMEPGSPAAVSIPFGTLPDNWYMHGVRYQVNLDRIITNRFTKDVDELRTYHIDLRQVISDNAIKDMLAEEDTKLINAWETACVSAGTTVPTSGVVQWKQISGGITRDSLWDSMMVLPSTPSRLETHTLIMNNLTIKHVCKIAFDESGGDSMSADVMKNGWSAQTYMGCRLIITIKQDIVPTNRIYQAADPSFMGKFFQLEDTVLYVRREAFFIEFFGYETCGGAIANTNAVAIVDFV